MDPATDGRVRGNVMNLGRCPGSAQKRFMSGSAHGMNRADIEYPPRAMATHAGFLAGGQEIVFRYVDLASEEAHVVFRTGADVAGPADRTLG